VSFGALPAWAGRRGGKNARAARRRRTAGAAERRHSREESQHIENYVEPETEKVKVK
jgi:hypothetical protein